MAWEDRGGKQYYYRKRREGDQVISEYVGRGAVADMVAEFDQEERERKAAKRRAIQVRISEANGLELRIRQVHKRTRALVRAAMLLNGYHPHKGQWRKRRDV